MHDGLQVIRLFEMRQCLNDGQIPCRWSAHMGFEYGQPLFNFYSAFPYYLGGLINLLGFSLISTAKILFLLSLVISGIFTYLLAKKYFSTPLALITSVAYLTAPYHALDIFVRGALAESWGLALIPMLLYAIASLIEKTDIKHLLFLSFSLMAFLTTHNISLFIWSPVIIVFTIIHFFQQANLKTLKFLLGSVLLGIGLSAFFLLPVLFEVKLINTSALITNYFQYQAHFTSFKQLFFDTHWDYGFSKFGIHDDLSFFAGIIQTIAIFISPFVIFYLFLQKKSKHAWTLISFFIFTIGSFFMTHEKSIAIWKISSVFSFVQFPWRFLGLSALGSSFLVGGVFNVLNLDKQKKYSFL